VKPIRFQLRVEHLWGLVALVGIFIFVNTHPIRPQDFWWHIAIGREISASGKIPTTDIYSYTEAGQAYPSYQMFWLMETILYQIYRLGGPALVIFIHSLIITTAYVIIFWISKRTTQSWRVAAFSVLFAAALGLNDWNVRPQDVTFLLGSLFLLAVFQYRQHGSWYWLFVFPLGMLVWVNSHGTFLIGLVLIGLWWGQELWDASICWMKGDHRLDLKALIVPAGIFVITILACLANPRGIRIIDYIKTLTSNSVVQNLVIEWAPPSLSTTMGMLFFGGLIGSACLFAVSPKRPSFYQLAAWVIFGILAIKTSRGIIWFGIVVGPVVGDHLAALTKQHHRNTQESTSTDGVRWVNILFASLVVLMGIISLPWFKSILPLPSAKAGLISSETPIKATQFLLEQKPPGKLFNSMSFGSYLIWAAYPQYQVFVDTRIELFSEKVWMDYLNISNANGDWEAMLDEYGVNTLMLSPVEQAPLIQIANTSSNWKLLYQDDSVSIFVRLPNKISDLVQ
jgi:hypothetical protein